MIIEVRISLNLIPNIMLITREKGIAQNFIDSNLLKLNYEMHINAVNNKLTICIHLISFLQIIAICLVSFLQ